VFPLDAADPQRQYLRNIFTLKMIRIIRLGTSFIPEKASSDMVASFFEPSSRDEKIAQDRSISNIVQTINQIIIILVATYFFGLWWYRLSDYIFMTYVLPDEPEERYWVVKFKLRHPKDYKGDDELMSISDRLILCMYYMLTTLSTVGYGDFYPFSIAEKIVGSLIQIIGVTIFSIVMNAFIGVVVSGRQNTFKDNETNLQRWF